MGRTNTRDALGASFPMWCPGVPLAAPAPDAKLWVWRGFEGAGEEAPCGIGGFRKSCSPPPAAGPSSHAPDVLCRAELKAEPKRGSVLSSVWEHPPRGSGPGLLLPRKCLGFLSSSSDLSRRQLPGSSGTACACNSACPSLPCSPWPPDLKHSQSKRPWKVPCPSQRG